MREITIRRLFVIGGIILILLTVIGFPFLEKAITEEQITITITDKDVKRYEDSDKYLIYTESGTFEITDSVAYWRWDSSDLYGKIEEGKTYTATVYGWRIPFISSYQNIVEVNEIN